MVGTLLFNFGFASCVPSWVNEKREGVSVNRSIWVAALLCAVIYLGLGIPAAVGLRREVNNSLIIVNFFTKFRIFGKFMI